MSIPRALQGMIVAAILGFSGCQKPEAETATAEAAPTAGSSASEIVVDPSMDPADVWKEDVEAIPSIASSESIVQPQVARTAKRIPQPPMMQRMEAPAFAPEPSVAMSSSPFETLPAGATHDAVKGYATVQVYYATDRERGSVPLSAYHLSRNKSLFLLLVVVAVLLVFGAIYLWFQGNSTLATGSAVIGTVAGLAAFGVIAAGETTIEKHGVTYTTDRGSLVRGICQVTVPDVHEDGLVERPSLLRFEVKEDQEKHVVLTSAIELGTDDFKERLNETIASSPDQDVLVFIHGYNVDFQSAVMRTAQIAVDLPFDGVPVCYSWPSQAKILGYSVDENNSQWTVAHLKQFLVELATETKAKSINVIAHSMGNRAMTAAMQQIAFQLHPESDKPFDQIVLAAPDVDADLFRRDLASPLLSVAEQVTLYASSDDQALIASKKVHGYPRAGESGPDIVVVPGIETVDVSGIDLSLLGHSYYGDNESMLKELHDVVRIGLPAAKRTLLIPKSIGPIDYWQLAQRVMDPPTVSR